MTHYEIKSGTGLLVVRAYDNIGSMTWTFDSMEGGEAKDLCVEFIIYWS